MTTFYSNGGQIFTEVGIEAFGSSVAIQTDGKILLAGRSLTGYANNLTLIRYNADGSLDSGFGKDGLVNIDSGNGGEGDWSLIIQNDGKILVAGEARASSDGYALARFNANGSLDNDFGGGGIVFASFGEDSLSNPKMAVQLDGKILVGVSTAEIYPDSTSFLLRYNSDGSLDSSFGEDGKVASSDYRLNSIAVQNDDKIIAIRDAVEGPFALFRYNSDGSLDSDFNDDGMVTSDDLNTSYDFAASSIAIQNDGKILIAGRGITYDFDPDSDFPSFSYHSDVAIARFKIDGSLDSSFGESGVIKTSFGDESSMASSITLQSDGKILIAGSAHINGHSTIALARYNVDGSLDSSFDEDGKVSTPSGYAGDVAIQADSKIVVTEENGYIFHLVRYNADGTLDGDATIVAAEHIFDWAESIYPTLLHGSPISQEIEGYHARIYANGNGLGEQNGNIYFYDGISIALVGTVSDFLPDAIAAGF